MLALYRLAPVSLLLLEEVKPRSVRYLLKRARSGPEKLLVLLRPLVRALFGSFRDEKRIMPLMGIGLGTAVVGRLVELLGLNITGAFYRSSETVMHLGFFQGMRLTLAYLIIFAAYLVLTTVAHISHRDARQTA